MDFEKNVKIKVDKGQRLTSSEQAFYDKQVTMQRAQELYSKWRTVATYAACVQAVKTDYIPSFENKCQDLKKSGFTI